MRIRAALGALLLLFLFGGLAHSAAPNRIRRRLGGVNPPPRAVQFSRAANQNLTVASNASLQVGAGNFSWAGWIRFASIGTVQGFITKWAGPAASQEYALYLGGSTADRIGLFVSNGAVFQKVEATTFGAPSVGVWYFVAASYDGAHLNISVNNGTVDQLAYSSGTRTAANPLFFGRDQATTNNFDGALDDWGFWKKALSAGEITQLYNGGKGLNYRNLDAGLRTSLISWYDWDGSLNDPVSANNLTNTNGVTFVPGQVN